MDLSTYRLIGILLFVFTEGVVKDNSICGYRGRGGRWLGRFIIYNAD